MVQRILSNLNTYLGSDYNETLLIVIVNKVIALIKLYRNYPSTYTEEMIEADLAKYEMKIFDISLVYFNKVGIEGEKIHDENFTKSTFFEDEKLYDFVTPIARCV